HSATPLLPPFPTRRSSDLAAGHSDQQLPRLQNITSRQLLARIRTLQCIWMFRKSFDSRSKIAVFDSRHYLDAFSSHSINSSYPRDRKSTRLNSSHDQISYA